MICCTLHIATTVTAIAICSKRSRRAAREMARRLVIISLFDVSASFVGSASMEGSCFTACRACSVMSSEHEEISIKNRALVNKAYLKRSLTFNSVYDQRRYNKKCTICQLFEKWGPKLVWINQVHY